MVITAIETINLSKNFGKTVAVKDVSLSIRKGEIYGFLGLNGAGKTTTIKTILGMIRPTSGRINIFGERVFPENKKLWEKIGYLVEIPYAYPDLTVYENLEIMRRLRLLKSKDSVSSIMKKLNIEQYSNRKAKHLSTGNAQRLGLAKAMIHNPSILLLDEPTNGLDPAGIHEVRELLKDLAHNHGITIFISSHILNEISKLADRIGIIHQGHLIQELESTTLNHLLNKCLLINTIDNDRAIKVLLSEGYIANKNENGNLEVVEAKAINKPDSIATILVERGIPPSFLAVQEEDLESYFLRIINTKKE